MRLNDFVELNDDVFAANVSQYGTTGWTYGRRAMAPATGYIPTRTLTGFPAGHRGGGRRMAMPKMPKSNVRHTPLGRGTAVGSKMHHPTMPKVIKPVTPKVFHPKLPSAKLPVQPHIEKPKLPHINPSNPGLGPVKNSRKTLAGEGEPLAGAFGHAHIDPVVWFRPPSLTSREKGTAAQNRIPVDNPGETNNRFLDVDKRTSKDTHKFRMGLLKRSTPGPQVPVRTSLVAPAGAVYMPGMQYAAVGMQSAAQNRMNRRVPSGGKRMFTSYSRRGCI